MTVQELRDFLAQETVNNDADVYASTDAGIDLINSIHIDDDGDVILSDEAE
jgi:hypothetical protein